MKIFSTIKICATLFCARTFGEYRYSGWNGEFEYSVYNWLGKEYTFPISHNEDYTF